MLNANDYVEYMAFCEYEKELEQKERSIKEREQERNFLLGQAAANNELQSDGCR